MSSTSPSITELGDFLSPLRPSSPSFADNFRPGSDGSKGFFFESSSGNDDMPSLGLSTVPIATANEAVGPATHPPAVYAQDQDWDNDGVSTLSVDEAKTTAGTFTSQHPGIVNKNSTVSITSTRTNAGNNILTPTSKDCSEFPCILYGILNSGRHDDVISWHDGGKAVLVTDLDRFANEILRDYFGHGQRPLKMLSFKRQLHRYGFHAETRLSNQSNKIFFFCSKNFQKERPDLLNTMRVQKKR